MKIRAIIVWLILTAMLTNCKSQGDGFKQFAEVKYNKNKPLDSFAFAVLMNYRLPGLAIATISDKQIKYSVVGNTKSNDGLPLDQYSKFQIASCTKAFTSLLVASCVQDGLISWETKISEVFPRERIHQDYIDVSVRDLLSHTSGISQFWTDEEVFEIVSIIPDLDGSIRKKRRVFTFWNLGNEAPFEKGEFHYSNGGYIVVAAMLEELTNQSYEDLMNSRIFQKLDLHSAEFGYPYYVDPSHPHRHLFRDESGNGILLSLNERIADPIFNPTGYISLTIEDFARFVLLHMRALNGENTSIDKNILIEVFKPILTDERGIGIGMGWQIIEVNGVITYGHTGSDGTMRSGMSINKEASEAIVFATNIGDPISERALINVIIEGLSLY